MPLADLKGVAMRPEIVLEKCLFPGVRFVLLAGEVRILIYDWTV